MDFTHVTGVTGLIIGIYLQQSCHFVLKVFAEAKSSHKLTLLLMGLGIILEFTSLAVLPLTTYVLVSSMHIAVFKHLLITDEKRKYTSLERFGTMAVISGTSIAVLFGGVQLAATEKEYQGVFDFYYYLYTFCSLLSTLAMRRCGFFSGKIMVETGIPAQVCSFAAAAFKIFWLSADVYKSMYTTLIMITCVGVGTFTLAVSNSFITELSKEHDLVIVMGGYYLWTICYCIPIGLFVKAGVEFNALNYIAILVSGMLVLTGIYLHSFMKIEYLKAYKENKYVRVPLEFIV